MDILKLLGAVTMFLDHYGAYTMPDLLILRVIGRLAFPLFAYLITRGLTFTSSRRRYYYRLLLTAAIAQVPYYFLRGYLFPLNVVFAFALFVGLFVMPRRPWYFLLPALMLFSITEYGFYAFGVLLAFWLVRDYRAQILLLAGLAYCFYGMSIQMFSILSIPLIWWLTRYGVRLPILPRRFFYYYYPGHLFYLLLIGGA